MDHHENDISQPMPNSSSNGERPEGNPQDEILIPQTPEHLSDNPEELKSFIHERDHAISLLRERNDDLQKKLVERQKTVTALTSRLEQAAEQLDRLHRSGADRGGKLLSGIPADVIDEQRDLINDLKSAIAHWEDLQSTSAMGRFEAQLAELREMLAEQLDLKNKFDTGPASPLGSGQTSSSRSATDSSEKTSWDEMKARLLGDQRSSSSDDTSDVKIPGSQIPGAEPQDGGTEETIPGTIEESEFDIIIEERPAAVENFEQAEAEVLREAVTVRDSHIDHLMDVIDRLKEQTGSKELEDSRERQKELEEKLRKAEIEMSMERAKLAREEARLKQMENDLNNSNTRKKSSERSAGDDEEDSGNRWVRFLGSK